ncbi:MAG: heavy metal-responsive transcriptional regulator [Gammaproteobacteria bacterium]|nr:heavy metal-responsive transcriptional regulator [Gammaproteobacteria bacterium]
MDADPGTNRNSAIGIGEASSLLGIPVDTLRYYERIGLIGRVARNPGGQRRFGPDDLARLRFVRRAQQMDFSLDEIGQLLQLRDSAGDVRSDVRALTETKLAAIESRIEALMRLRDELAGLVDACQRSEHGCPIIGRMDDSDSGHKAAGERS